MIDKSSPEYGKLLLERLESTVNDYLKSNELDKLVEILDTVYALAERYGFNKRELNEISALRRRSKRCQN